MRVQKILFLAPYPLHSAPSQRFRFEQYLDFLQKNGFDYDFQSFFGSHAWKILYAPGNFFLKILYVMLGYLKRYALLFQISKYKYVFIHRESTPYGPPLLEYLLSTIFKKKIIYDFDDAIWLPNYSHSNRFFASFKNYRNAFKIMQYAYKVSCGNQYLKQACLPYNTNVIVNPTTIDTAHHHNTQKQYQQQQSMVIGWTGTHSTIRYLNDLLPVFHQLNQAGFSYTLLVISDIAPDFSLPNLVFQKWKKETEVSDLLKIDLGIMPLLDDEWARGKCGFKALQYMSLGIPSVVSPVGVNEEIVQHSQNGFVAKTNDEWFVCLSALMQNQSSLATLGKNARKTVEERYSVLSNQQNFINLFK